MTQISVDLAQPGMVLAADVVDRRGRLLVPAGGEITERHLTALRMWGVSVIDVVGEAPSGPAEAELPPELLAEIDEEMDDLFSVAGEDEPFLAELRRLATRARARSLVPQGAA